MKLDEVLRLLYSQSRVMKNEGQRYVVKCYGSSVGLKWYFISSAFRTFPYVASPETRMRRELEFLTYPWTEIKVPRLIDFDLEEKCIVREYIEGNLPESPESISTLGKVIRYIHDNSFVLGDTKLENFLVADNIYVIDAEEAIVSDDLTLKAWDILVFALFISYKYIQDLKLFEKTMQDFLRFYNPSHEVALNIMSVRNFQLLSLFPPIHLNIMRKIISEF
ncbi:serine/threonine protein kinase [Metallosphaera tengchongensis]|uniref:Serine/threonine protein kinase n=1 Tax=Metallosphaera tengchongensis TaxID=1532350 RepID=A0A6N0NRC5_9CREN|nr:serine/threonine protein kinase [Metallosphaera tengchongensis]QKQ99295.1 serine/threonine protein kinase [Metallosphaera tengchongensis]